MTEEIKSQSRLVILKNSISGRPMRMIGAGILILVLAAIAVFAFIKPAPDAIPAEETAKPIKVTVQKASESRSLEQTLKFPAIVRADEEASIIAKSAGTVKSASFEVGDQVKVGQELVRIDDVSAIGGNYSAGFTATQVRQATLAVEQARAAYLQAQQSYLDALASSERDLNQASIARDQAAQGEDNLGITTAEALKSAELAYETAQAATEQAKIGLESRQAISGQSAEDIRTNGEVAAGGAISTAGNLIVSINNLMGFDDTTQVAIPYKNNLGVLEENSYFRAQGSYNKAELLFENSRNTDGLSTEAKIDQAIKLIEVTKKLADDTRLVLDRSVTSLDLPQTSSVGVSLSGLQASVAGFQSQLSAVLAQVNGAKQGLTSTDLNNDATLSSLEKAYEIAQTQEALARQNLENLKAGNKTQTDNASFGVSAADNQYQSLKIKLNSQNTIYRTQMTVAELAYRNAQAVLQNVYDIHLGVAPINGTVTKKLVNVGDTVSPGQILAVVSEASEVVLTFYVDRDTMSLVKTGQAAKIVYNGNEPVDGHITSVALSADDLTKRFLAEARPDRTEPGVFALGTVMEVIVSLTKEAKNEGTVILPIAAVNIGQNETSILIVEDGAAKALPVTVLRVEGETVEVEAEFDPETLIIVGNNKFLNSGTPVEY